MPTQPPFDPTRYIYGVGTADNTEVLGNWGMPDPTHYHSTFDDFNALAGWTAAGSAALAAGAGGLLSLPAAGSIIQAQAVWQFDAGLRQFLKARVALVGGTSVATLGFVDSISAPTTGVYMTLNGNGTCTLVVGTATVTFQRPFVASQFFIVGIEHDPRDHRVYLYINGKKAAGLPDTTMPTTALFLGATSATAAASLDYIFASFERAQY